MISSRDVTMSINRAYGTCYAILTNYMALIRSSYYGPPCSCRQTRRFSLSRMFYPNVDMQAFNHQRLSGTIYKDHYVAQYEHWMLSRVHEHAGSGATHLSLVAHQTLSIDMLTHGLYVTKGSTFWGSSSTILGSYMYGHFKV